MDDIKISEQLDFQSETIEELVNDTTLHFALLAKVIGIIATGLAPEIRQHLVGELRAISEQPMFAPGNAEAELILDRIANPDGWDFPIG